MGENGGWLSWSRRYCWYLGWPKADLGLQFATAQTREIPPFRVISTEVCRKAFRDLDPVTADIIKVKTVAR
jgi:hypothetical protein